MEFSFSGCVTRVCRWADGGAVMLRLETGQEIVIPLNNTGHIDAIRPGMECTVEFAFAAVRPPDKVVPIDRSAA